MPVISREDIKNLTAHEAPASKEEKAAVKILIYADNQKVNFP